MERAFLFLSGLCWVGLVLVLILWDGKPRGKGRMMTMNTTSGGWVSFHCPCCNIGFDYPDVDGVPQWQTTTCMGEPMTALQIHEHQCHYTADAVQDAFGPAIGPPVEGVDASRPDGAEPGVCIDAQGLDPIPGDAAAHD